MKSHSFLLLHILTLIDSWKSIARDAREKGESGHPSIIGRSMCVCCVCWYSCSIMFNICNVCNFV